MDGDTPIRLLIALSGGRHGLSSEALLIARIAPPYYLFKDHSADVVLATPLGGFPALLPPVRQTLHQDALAQRFLSDRTARDDLAETLSLAQIVTEDFDAAFCIGMSEAGQAGGDDAFTPTARSFLASGKPVAIVPGSAHGLPPAGAASGLLILGGSREAPLLAAHALLKVAQERRHIRAGTA